MYLVTNFPRILWFEQKSKTFLECCSMVPSSCSGNRQLNMQIYDILIKEKIV